VLSQIVTFLKDAAAPLAVVIAALLAALYAYKSKIHHEAWLSFFQEKRSLMTDFLDSCYEFQKTLSRFPKLTYAKSQLDSNDEADRFNGMANVAELIKELWPEGEKGGDTELISLGKHLPEIADLTNNTPAFKKKTGFLFNGISNKLKRQLRRITENSVAEVNRLSLYAKDPYMILYVHQFMVALGNETIRNFGLGSQANVDFALAIKKWNGEMVPVRERLRADLQRSARSLRAATRTVRKKGKYYDAVAATAK
jgi:hypothetical protein